MSILQKNVLITPEDYLEGEKYSEVKHEYVAGHVYAMVGASEPHNRIALNLATALNVHLRDGPCRVFMSDMKVRVRDAFYYPDVLVTCDRTDANKYYKTQPVLVVEVLSSTTEEKDSREKRVAYQSLPSLQEYVLVAQDRMDVRSYRRTPEGWDLETCFEGDRVKLDPVGLDIPIEAIYEEVWR
jgi:Uma2 family endonuclease